MMSLKNDGSSTPLLLTECADGKNLKGMMKQRPGGLELDVDSPPPNAIRLGTVHCNWIPDRTRTNFHIQLGLPAASPGAMFAVASLWAFFEPTGIWGKERARPGVLCEECKTSKRVSKLEEKRWQN